jgi:hypothetical protein
MPENAPAKMDDVPPKSRGAGDLYRHLYSGDDSIALCACRAGTRQRDGERTATSSLENRLAIENKTHRVHGGLSESIETLRISNLETNPVLGEFLKSRGDGCLVKAATVLLPAI